MRTSFLAAVVVVALWAGASLLTFRLLPRSERLSAADAAVVSDVRRLVGVVRRDVAAASRDVEEQPQQRASHRAAHRARSGSAVAIPAVKGDRRPVSTDPSSGIDDTPLAEALDVWRRKSSAAVEESCTSSKHFQSSRQFHDFRAPNGPGYGLPTEPPAHGELAGHCDDTDYDFSKDKDQNCRKFLADFRNWRRLRPLSSVLSEARTIKFIATLGEGESSVRAVIKVPQFKFLVEPYSELVSFETDRLLGVERVPPTAWVAIPLSWFRAAAAVFMPDVYVQWVECFVFNHTSIHHLIGKWSAPERYPQSAVPGETSIWVSAQLWMQGVKPLGATALKPPHNYESLLDPSSGHWPPHQPNLAPSLSLWALAEISDQSVFDHIIGNSDRTVHKNAFAVGDCDSPKWDCSDDGELHRRPRMVFLDQGSSFYSRGPTRVSLYKDDASACRFRRSTYNRIQSVADQGLDRALFAALPHDGFLNHAHRSLVAAAQTRSVSLLEHISHRCLSRFPKRDVFPFD